SKKISCSSSHESSHHTRQQVDAILIGSSTAVLDNPLLTARVTPDSTKQPLRIIVTTRMLPLALKIFDPNLPGKTLVATTNHAKSEWIQQLREKNTGVMVLPSDS